MGRWAQPSITFLNAPRRVDPTRYATDCGQKRCLFPALNQAACAGAALLAPFAGRHFERVARVTAQVIHSSCAQMCPFIN